MTTKVIKLPQYLSQLGISKLKPEQKQIVTAVLNGRDTMSILPTGFGKSVCYVLPHLISKRNVIIVSPLVSLIRDQELKYKHICNTFVIVGGRISYNGRNGIDMSEDIQNNKVTALIFMTPEKLLCKRKWVTSLDVLTIAIDECHCITEWANFRQGYLELSTIVKWFIDGIRPSILAVTATATAKTTRSISEFFQLKNPLFVRISAVRDNLNLIVERKTKLADDLKKLSKLASGKTIIYCKTRKDTEKIAERLKCDGGTCYYHAGMSPDDKELVQDGFCNGKYRVIVATIAFGMGIDIPDISTVIHYGLPKDIESYCQEIGRAARAPGSEATCYLLWGKGDMIVNGSFIKKLEDVHERDYQQRKTNAMNKFVDNCYNCRMCYIAKYFEPESTPKKCMKCDICNKNQSRSMEHLC